MYRLRTDPQVSGKRSTALAVSINGSHLRKATDQELVSLVEKLEKSALLDHVEDDTISSTRDDNTMVTPEDVAPISFVLHI